MLPVTEPSFTRAGVESRDDPVTVNTARSEAKDCDFPGARSRDNLETLNTPQ
ncbi:hypothetical protein PGT21_004805 [Puccinia graminis f. sp. tritici]|uniref:Uncharacterized protein n=1 Tax=Puccinia graminis f. sp. tritici TaxID=56615 RepID=A0A5B0PSW6_PUCGR|nr:hypothetical protein PGTUg99_013910 [Puccinia graminis f. sp. tritici]KAA1103039.1 hypothetical protein PGT21_004805 [Puccinia graminis f. sp. tritici]